MPTRSDAEVAAIFATHCQPCEHYDPAAHTCAVCGCRVRADGAALLNKIKMGTEHRPKGKWWSYSSTTIDVGTWATRSATTTSKTWRP